MLAKTKADVSFDENSALTRLRIGAICPPQLGKLLAFPRLLPNC